MNELKKKKRNKYEHWLCCQNNKYIATQKSMMVVVVVLLVQYTDCPSCVYARSPSLPLSLCRLFAMGLHKTNKLYSIRKEIKEGGKKKSCGCCNADRKSNHLFVPNQRRSRNEKDKEKRGREETRKKTYENKNDKKEKKKKEERKE